MSLEILSQASVDHLRLLARSGVPILETEFDELISDFDLTLLDSDYTFDASIELSLPEGSKQEKNNDIPNCLKIAKILPELDDLAATDERLWVTLALRNFKEYSVARWPLNESKADTSKYFKDHWFAHGTRERLGRHSISRLWWYQRICARIDEESLESTLELLLFNSDYRSSMLERNTTSAVTKIVACIISLTHEYAKKGISYNRDNFRDFMKQLDMLAGRSHLAVLTEDQLHKKLSVLYLEAMS